MQIYCSGQPDRETSTTVWPLLVLPRGRCYCSEVHAGSLDDGLSTTTGTMGYRISKILLLNL